MITLHHLLFRSSGVILCACCTLPPPGATAADASAERPHSRIELTTDFLAEGGTLADLNRDGAVDAIVGPYWFEGPTFSRRHEIRPPSGPFDPLQYSDTFFAFAHDFDRDGWLDLLMIGFPGKEAAWWRNPGASGGAWQRHLVLDGVGNESPAFGDLFGDEEPVLMCMTGSRFGYAVPDPQDPTRPWTFHPVTPPHPWNAFTHGLGFGDVNGDGRADLLEGGGWWEQPAARSDGQLWTRHPVDFGKGAQMYATDINGDGRNDVVTSRNAHGYGLAWFENRPARTPGGSIEFQRHDILPETADGSSLGVQFSQLHAVALADVDGDGILDIVTGKRWWAHGPEGDVDPNGTPVIHAFLVRRAGDGSVSFQPRLIDDASGVGTQLSVADINGDGRADLLSVNKRGAWVFVSR